MKGWLSKKKEKTKSKPKRNDINWNLCAIGFVSSAVQLLLVKEVMNIAGGNELMTGVFMCLWLILSAIGVRIGGASKSNNLKRINYLFFLSPIVSLLLLTLCSTVLIESGETPSFLKSILLISIVVAPVCLISGYAFIRITEMAILDNHSIPGKAYSKETLGGIIAGIFISIFSSGYINTYLLLITIILLSLLYFIYAFLLEKSDSMKTVCVIFLIGEIAIAYLNPDVFFRNMILKGADISYSKDTPYGNISVADDGTTKNIFYDHRLISFDDDVTSREEDIHYAMLQNAKIKDVLMISGALESRLDELAKYNIDSVTYIEQDPFIIKLTNSLSKEYPFHLDINAKDAYNTIKTTHDKYDAVISLISDPSTLSSNRFYTYDFFQNVKAKLNDGGVFMCTPGPGDNYLNDESVKLYSSIYNSLTKTFEHVAPVIGEKLYFIASDNDIRLDFAMLSQQRKITNQYVNIFYLQDELIQTKSIEITNRLDTSITKNSVRNPVACFYYQSFNLSRDNSSKKIALSILAILIIASIIIFRKRDIYMYINSMTLSGFEIIVLFMIQITIGNMYKITGFVLACIMAGLAIGSGMNIKFISGKNIKQKTKLLIGYYIVMGLLFGFIDMIPPREASILIIATTILPSMITGSIYKEITINNGKGSSTAKTYSADLIGSALGFIIISVIIVPLIGIQLSLFSLAALMATCLLFNTSNQ